MYYQAATFTRHPASSLMWIGGLTALFVVVVVLLWAVGRRGETLGPPVPMKS